MGSYYKRDFKEIIREIRDRVSIKEAMDICGLYPNRGMYSCILHKDDKPSVSIHSGFYHCFSCHKKLDAIGVVAEFYKIKNIEAAKVLDEKFSFGLFQPINIETKKRIDEETRIRKEKELKEKRREQFTNSISVKIIEKIKLYESIMSDCHITRGEYRNGNWNMENLYFYALKEKDRLQYILSVVNDNPDLDGYLNYVYGTDKTNMLNMLKLGVVEI